MTSKVIQGHIRPLLSQNYSSTFVYGPILMKLFMNANIMKTQYNLKCSTFIMEFCIFLNVRLSDLITTLTYILMDNFCPCFRIRFTLDIKKKTSFRMFSEGVVKGVCMEYHL